MREKRFTEATAGEPNSSLASLVTLELDFRRGSIGRSAPA